MLRALAQTAPATAVGAALAAAAAGCASSPPLAAVPVVPGPTVDSNPSPEGAGLTEYERPPARVPDVVMAGQPLRPAQ